jgi:hypothetical protein
VGEGERDLVGEPPGRVGRHPLAEGVGDGAGVQSGYQLVNKIGTNRV